MKQLISACMIAAACAATLPAAGDIRLASGGKTDYTIIYKPTRDALLDLTVRDFAGILKEITGATFPIKENADGPKIYIGKRAPGDDAPFQSRERRIRSVGKDIYLYGDYRFGT